MNQEIKKVLNKIEQNGFEAYIVGGFVRDYLLCRGSNDIDICTNALPKDLQQIFGASKETKGYGSYNLKTNSYNYDITTYRIEHGYSSRHPVEIEYTSNLLVDLNRRDFTMNAICMDQHGKIINLLNGVEDIENKTIRMIGDPKVKLKEDPLRILRAIRFACVLNFKIEETLWQEIITQKECILTLSNYRIKKEMDGILLSPNFKKGIELLEKSGIFELLGFYYKEMVYVNDLCGMWAQIKTNREYPFTNIEKQNMKSIIEILNLSNINAETILRYGLYPCRVASIIKNLPKDTITNIYEKMPLHEEKDLAVNFPMIQKITNLCPKDCQKIKHDLISKILNQKLKNEREELIAYLKEKSVSYEL